MLAIPYATEGAPLLITDTASAGAWAGHDADASGVVVEYMARGAEKLPAELLQTKKPGMQKKTFATLDEARAFEAKLLSALKKIHPKAARPPEHPNHPGFYEGGTRVYSIEVTYTSMFATTMKALKSDCQVLVFDKKRKAQGLFVQQQGGGRGLVVADGDPKSKGQGRLIVAKLHHGVPDDPDALARALLGLAVPRSKLKLKLDGRVVIFDSAQSQRDVATATWRAPSLPEAAGKALAAASAVGGALKIPEQQAPGGAYVKLAAGEYAISYADDADVDRGASVVWLSPAR